MEDRNTFITTDAKSPEQIILECLEQVKDPEIPVVSVVELGIITDVQVRDANQVCITMTPTFTGCPAIDYMKKYIEVAVEKLDFVETVEVKVDFSQPWTSDKISESGRKKIEEFGLAPPPKIKGEIDVDLLNKVNCPNCKSSNTSLNNMFGPTLCRAVHLCFDCKETFEAFKPV